MPPLLSLSARRAWIEKYIIGQHIGIRIVALRKESVDRKFYYSDKDVDWVRVALRKESVDRKLSYLPMAQVCQGRSPQGERG